MDDDKVAFGRDHARLIFERRGRTLDEVEETFAARLDVGAVLDIVRRPEAFGGRVVSLVEQGVECLKDERLVLRFRRLIHFILPTTPAWGPQRPKPGGRRRLADPVDTVRIEGDVILDLRHRFKWGLISPHRIDGTIPASRTAVVGSVALVGAIRRVLATRERGHIDIPTVDILNGRI